MVRNSVKPWPTLPSAKYHVGLTGPEDVGIGVPVGVGAGVLVPVGVGDGVGVGTLLVMVKPSLNVPPDTGTNCAVSWVAETVNRDTPQVGLTSPPIHVLK